MEDSRDLSLKRQLQQPLHVCIKVESRQILGGCHQIHQQIAICRRTSDNQMAQKPLVLHLFVIWESRLLAELDSIFHYLVQIIIHYITVIHLNYVVCAVLLVKSKRQRAVLVLIAK